MRRIYVISGILALAASLFLAVPAQSAPQQLSLAVGTLTGTMARLGTGLVEVFNRNSKDVKLTIIPGGGATNPERAGIGGANFAITFSNFAQMAYDGKKPYKAAYPKLRSVLKLYDSVYHQYIARDVYEGGIRSWDDIVKSKRPLRLGLSGRGTSSEWFCYTILGSYGLTYDDLRKRGFTLVFAAPGPMSRVYGAKQIDIYFHNAGPPHSGGIRAALARPLAFMNMPEPLAKKLAKLGVGPATIPANSYKGQTKPVHSVGLSGMVLTLEKMDPNIVYALLKHTHNNKKYLVGVHKIYKKLDPKTSWKKMNIPLHEGARRYYREQGVALSN